MGVISVGSELKLHYNVSVLFLPAHHAILWCTCMNIAKPKGGVLNYIMKDGHTKCPLASWLVVLAWSNLV